MSSVPVSLSSPDDVVASLKAARKMLRRFGVRRIGLFGSFARGDQTADSDLDFLVELEKPSFSNFMDLAFYLEDRFGRRVELITNGNLSPYIAPVVEQEVRWCET
jgi:predicted nucleotidyltransferase